MDRRAFIGTMTGSLLAAPLAAEGQPAGKVPRVGVLVPGDPTPGSLPLQVFEAFRSGLRELGHIEGQTIVLEPRWDENRAERYASLASALVDLKVDVIVAGTTPTSLAAKSATTTIPIVMAAFGADPVTLGLVASLSRPGGNVTGLTLQAYDLPGKRLELLKEALPSISRVVLFWHPVSPSRTEITGYETAARALGLQLQAIQVGGPEDFDGAFRAVGRSGARAVVMIQSAAYATHRVKLASIALKTRLATMSGETGFARDGGLMNYGPNIPESWKRAATYVDKILKGAKPGDLPIEQPTKFDLVINLKTAKALGLTIPPSLLTRADQVIE
jgi:putative ABC transport system substrate-binding protein